MRKPIPRREFETIFMVVMERGVMCGRVREVAIVFLSSLVGWSLLAARSPTVMRRLSPSLWHQKHPSRSYRRCKLNSDRGGYESIGTDFSGDVSVAFGRVNRKHRVVWDWKCHSAGWKPEVAHENAS